MLSYKGKKVTAVEGIPNSDAVKVQIEGSNGWHYTTRQNLVGSPTQSAFQEVMANPSPALAQEVINQPMIPVEDIADALSEMDPNSAIREDEIKEIEAELDPMRKKYGR